MEGSADADQQMQVRTHGTVADLGRRALESDDVDRLLDDAAAAVAETVGVQYGAVFESVPGADEAAVRAGVGWRDGTVDGATVAAGPETPVGAALRTGEPVVVDDLAADDRFDAAALMSNPDVASGVSVVVGPREDPWGALGAYATEPGAVSDRDVAVARNVAALLGSAIETERARTGREERERAIERYETIVEEVNDGVYVVDEDGYFVLVNEAYTDILGYDREELIGSHVSLVVDESVRERAADLEAAMDDTDAEREPTIEAEIETVDGERIPLEARFALIPDDSEGHRVGVVRDVRERKERERRLSTLMDNVPGMVYRCCNERGWPMDFVSEGCRELTGYDPGTLERGDVSWGGDVILSDDRDDLWTEIQRALDEGGSFLVTYRIETAGGAVRWVRERGRVVADEAGGRTVLEGVVIDVTERKRLESELDEVFGRVTDAFYALDEEWQITHANERAEELIDYSGEGLVGRNLWEVFEWGEASRLREEYERAMETQEPASFELYYPSPLDAWYEVNAYPSDTGLSVYFRDVTERVERERRLEMSERRYRTLVENFPNGAVALVDEDLRYRTAGGRPVDEAVETGADLEGATVREVLSEELADVVEPRYRAALNGESSTFEREHGDSHSRFHIFPVRDEDGAVFAAMGMSQDITERIAAERRLAESEQRYRTIVEHFPNGAVGLFDENLEYTAAGGQILEDVGASEEDIVGQTVWERYPEDVAETLAPKFRSALDGERDAFDLEFRDRHWLAHTLPVGDDDGTISAGMMMVQDVTERTEYQLKLEQSNERLEQFAYAASHDLQEPLRMVSSYLQLIENRYADDLDDEGREFIDFAVAGADRMREMIEGLLEYSRVDTRGDPFEPVDLNAVVAEVRDDLRVKIDESDADVDVDVDDLPTVRGDGSQLRQLFQNLLDNAIEYSGDEPPRVTVTAERRGTRPSPDRGGAVAEAARDQWVVSVSDDGIGIGPDGTEQVFEVFERLHTADEHAGTGIGLALCERIVERHGGDIWVDSEPGAGATFSFTLPAADED